jgi:hypothetical protein
MLLLLFSFFLYFDIVLDLLAIFNSVNTTAYNTPNIR